MTKILIDNCAVRLVKFQHPIFLALLISFNCSAETSTFPQAQVMVEQINGYNIERVGAPMRLEQGGSNRFDDRVFLPLVAADGKPITEKKPETKGDPAVQRDYQGIGEQFKHHGIYWLLIPAIWFLLGLVLGGAFER